MAERYFRRMVKCTKSSATTVPYMLHVLAFEIKNPLAFPYFVLKFKHVLHESCHTCTVVAVKENGKQLKH